MITIVLADDHHLVRQGFRTLLEDESGLTIVGEAADGLEALEQVERLKPNILILDLVLPGLSGLIVTRRVNQQFPETAVIVLSMYSNEAHVAEALRSGATGYVLKKGTAGELVKAIHQVYAGQRYLSPSLSIQNIEAHLNRAAAGAQEPFELLTPRQQEVLQLVAEGYTSAEIAFKLAISPRTVEMHRANLMRKLNFRSQANLIRYALKLGLIPPDDILKP